MTPRDDRLKLHGVGVSRVFTLVQVVVAVPQKLSKEEEELIRQLAKLQEGKVNDKSSFIDNILGFFG